LQFYDAVVQGGVCVGGNFVWRAEAIEIVTETASYPPGSHPGNQHSGNAERAVASSTSIVLNVRMRLLDLFFTRGAGSDNVCPGGPRRHYGHSNCFD